MEHVVNLLRQPRLRRDRGHRGLHGQRHPHLLRRRLGVRRPHVYATEETPLGTAGSVRNARDQLDERFLVISGDVLTDIDLTAGRRVPREAGCAGHAGPEGGREPARIRHRHHPRGRRRSSASSRSRRGARCSATPSTPASTCSNRRCSTTSPTAGPSTSRASLPGRPRDGQAASTGTSTDGLLGGRRHARGLPRGAPGHPRRAGHRRRPRASRCDRASGWARAPRSTRRRDRRAGAHRRQLHHRCRARGSATYSVLGSNVRIGDEAVVERVRRPRQLLSGRGVRIRAACSAAATTCGRAPAARRASSSATVLRRRPREDQRGREGLPVQDGRGRGDRQLVDRVGVAGCRMLFGRDGVRGLANVDISPELAVRLSMAWASTLEKGSTITTSRDTSRAARVLKRAIMVGCNAAGVNVDDLEAATVPVTRFQVGSTTSLGDHRPARPRRPAVGDDPLLRRARPRRRRDHPAQDRAAVPPRGVPSVLARRSATSGFRPGLWSTTRPRSPRRSTWHRCGRPASSWCSTTPSGRPASSCPPCCRRWAPRSSS